MATRRNHDRATAFGVTDAPCSQAAARNEQSPGVAFPATIEMRSPDREFECRNDGGESTRSGGDDAKKKDGGTECTRDEMEGRQSQTNSRRKQDDACGRRW